MFNKLQRLYGTLRYSDSYWWKNWALEQLSKIIYRNDDGETILNKTWDHLIILDACRYDYFEKMVKLYGLNGKLEKIKSVGTCTPEFLVKNFKKEKLEDVIYVTANPYVNKYLANSFFKLIPVWNLDFDEELNTVHPRKIVTYSKILFERYPEKKFIIHLMQPHYPFLNKKIEGTTGIKQLTERMLNKRSGPGINVFNKLQKGLITLNEIKDSYNENLFIVMKYVIDIVNLLDGKIIITSDHGEALGENYHKYLPIKVYGHPRGTRIDALTNVPWYEIKK